MTTALSDILIIEARGERELFMSRVFAVPRRLVFDAWTKPELFIRWFGPHGWSVPVCAIDLRSGGKYRWVMRKDDGAEVAMWGEYHEIVPPERLVYTENFEDFAEVGWRPEDAALITATFTEEAGRTTWGATALYPSREVRDAVMALDVNMKRGLTESFEKLASLLDALAEV